MAGSGKAHLRPEDDVLLRAEDLTVEFKARGKVVHAVSGVNIDVRRGETLGLVGESGCGKSTTGRALMQLPRPTSGTVQLAGEDLTRMSGDELRRVRPRMQMIYQDPIASLNPRRTVGDIVGEPLLVWRDFDRRRRAALVDEMLAAVGLDPDVSRGKRPREFSGGQCQRICIARALILKPEVVLCDEPVSSLDVSVQAQILNLLEDMKEQYSLTMVFIAHDLAVVKNISDRVVVMYLGKVCEVGAPDLLYERPAHPYTFALLSAVPVPDPEWRNEARGLTDAELPSPLAPPAGCRFHTRCPHAQERCRVEEPVLRRVGDGDQFVACHFPLAEPLQ